MKTAQFFQKNKMPIKSLS